MTDYMDSEDDKDFQEREERSSERLDDINGWKWQVYLPYIHAYVHIGLQSDWTMVMAGSGRTCHIHIQMHMYISIVRATERCVCVCVYIYIY